MALSIRDYLRPAKWKGHIHDLATVSPLIAGVIAPLSVLLDIPALTEKWYAKDGTPEPDPKASLILSGVALAFSVIANAIMLMRFSDSNRRRRLLLMIPLSTSGWIVKVVVSLANLILFGVLTRNQPSFSYLEGFWCAVVSCITSAIVLFFLSLHWIMQIRAQKAGKKESSGSNKQVRVSGRHFMLSTTFFLALIAVSALIFSRIEGWTYLEGIYFFVVTFLTVGFGDFSPTHPATQILLFPLALLGVAALGSLLEVIIRFFSARSASRKAAARARLERKRQQDESARQDVADLHREIEFLEHLSERQDAWDQATEFALSFVGFLAFWLVGAAIFSALEGWSYGVSLYFCYVFFLSIGYGDFSPVSPAGRVVFIVYSLLAVPVMAAFAVQAVTQIMTRLSIWRLEKRREDEGVEETTSEWSSHVLSHADYILRCRQRWTTSQSSHKSGVPSTPTSSRNTSAGDLAQRTEEKRRSVDAKEAKLDEEEKEVRDVEKLNIELVRTVIEHAVTLELHARRLLIYHLPEGSRAEVLLKADRNVQLRDLRALLRQVGANKEADDLDAGTTGNGKDLSEDERAEKRRRVAERLGLGDAAAEDADWVSRPMSDEQVMQEVSMYRESFAGLLVAGSVLQELEGKDMLILERRREERKASKQDGLVGTPPSEKTSS